jgi:hypothetical protein
MASWITILWLLVETATARLCTCQRQRERYYVICTNTLYLKIEKLHTSTSARRSSE